MDRNALTHEALARRQCSMWAASLILNFVGVRVPSLRRESVPMVLLAGPGQPCDVGEID